MRKELLISSMIAVILMGCSSQEGKDAKSDKTTTPAATPPTQTVAPTTAAQNPNEIDELNTSKGVDQQIPQGQGTTTLAPTSEKIEQIQSGTGIDQPLPSAKNDNSASQVTPLTEITTGTKQEEAQSTQGTSMAEQEQDLSNAMQNANDAVQSVQQILNETQQTLKDSNLSNLESQPPGTNPPNLTGVGSQSGTPGNIQTLKNVNAHMQKEEEKGSAVTDTDLDIATQPTPVNFSGSENKSAPSSAPSENIPTTTKTQDTPATPTVKPPKQSGQQTTDVPSTTSTKQGVVAQPGSVQTVVAPAPSDDNE